jgi:hypothetical protein
MRHLLLQGSVPTDSSYRVLGNAEEIPKNRTMPPTTTVLVCILRLSLAAIRHSSSGRERGILPSAVNTQTSKITVHSEQLRDAKRRRNVGVYTTRRQSKAYNWWRQNLERLV